jgi:hypothetical protein
VRPEGLGKLKKVDLPHRVSNQRPSGEGEISVRTAGVAADTRTGLSRSGAQKGININAPRAIMDINI